MSLDAEFANRHNFSAGPGVLPEKVLNQLSAAILEVPDVGLSLLGISHRSEWFKAVVDECCQQIRTLMGLDEDWAILLLQGGATQQFSQVPEHFLRGHTQPADYLCTGYWSSKSLPPARLCGPMRCLWDGACEGFSCLPEPSLAWNPRAPYLHYISNETVEGLQFGFVPGLDEVPRVCDMSSDFLSRPVDASKFSLIYAHAQKNLGPAGVTVVLVRRSWLQGKGRHLPDYLQYEAQIKANSILNTPPVLAIYTVLLVLRWLRHDVGGLQAMAQINARKAAILYSALAHGADQIQVHANKGCRSQMNVAFRFGNPTLQQRFLGEAHAAGLHGLEGHRSIGGVRVSLYNAMTIQSVQDLSDFITDFFQNS